MKRVLENFEEILAGGFILVMVSLVILNVFLRYLFSYSIFWVEEVSTICFVWSVFLGGSAVYKRKMDIGIDVLVKKCPDSLQRLIFSGVRVLLLMINGYLFYMSLIFTRDSFQKPTAVLGTTSAVVNSALIVSFGLITFHTVRFVLADLRSREGEVA